MTSWPALVALLVIIIITRNQYASPPQGNTILAGPLSNFDEIVYR